jgi:arylsulfatase A-like enzyme
MKTNTYIRKLATLLFFLTGSITILAQTGVDSLDHPNVIMVATDDLNSWVNPLGYAQAKTPHLDRLAAMGVSFLNAHAPAAYCAPSRSAIWSGLHASSTGCYNDELYYYDRPELVSLQTAFKQAGYQTFGAGKLYHHRAGSFDPRGWDTYFSRSQEIRDWGYEMGYRGSDVPFPDPRPFSPYYNDPRSPYYLEPGEVPDWGGFLEWGPIAPEEAELIPDAIRTNWVCELLEKEHSDPFFIGLGLYSPHFPNYAPQQYFDWYDRDSIEVPELYAEDLDDLPDHIRTRMTNRLIKQQTLEEVDAVEDAVLAYLACVSFADAMLGRVLDALEASAYHDNTLVIFWSDQGYHHGEKGQWGKHTLWQETSHVPFIFAGNGLPENKQVESTVSLIDIYPTLIDLCNLDLQHPMDGVSLVPVLTHPDSTMDRNVLMSYMERGGYALINKDWRYIQYHDGSEELYDLNSDPNEWYNLASDPDYRSLMDEMKQSAPAEFQKEATPRNTLNLVIQDSSFYWEPKDKSADASFIDCSVLFTNPIRQQGLSFVESTNRESPDFTEQVVIGNKDCRYIPANRFCYFTLDDQWFTENDQSVRFRITYYDETNSMFELQYNTQGSAEKSIPILKTNTRQWLTKTVRVADAEFSGKLDHQSDFRITGDVCIRSVHIDKALPSEVEVVFDDQIIQNGMEFLVRTDPEKETYTEDASIGEAPCRYIPWEDKRKYAYFRVDDAKIAPTEKELTFEITYFDKGTSPLSIQYNAISATYKVAEFPRTNSNTWISKTYPVTDAALENLQNNQSDFRIRGEAYVRRVAVRRGIENPKVPDIPVVYVFPQSPDDPSGKRPEKSSELDFQVVYKQEHLLLHVPKELIQGELRIYTYTGKVIYIMTIKGTEHLIPIHLESNAYIVIITKEGIIKQIKNLLCY